MARTPRWPMARTKLESWESTGLELLKEADFDGTRLKREGRYAVCFAATWCPPTRHFVPMFVGRNGTLPVHFAIADITDLEDPLWDTFRIKITPTMAVFREGKLTSRFDGRRFIGLRKGDLDRLGNFVASEARAGESGTGPIDAR
jgi:hypothetical protein